MELHEYISNVEEFVFSTWIDIPFEFEYMVEITATQFFYHNIALDECCRFAELIINIHTEGEFDYVFEYEPFNVLDDEISPEFVYEIDNTVNPEILTITLANPTLGIVPTDFMSLNETVRRFITFLQITERELDNIDIEESKKKDILYNYILKFEIATAPEIINFLGIELAESKFITKKKLYKEVLQKHYALNPIVLQIFEDIA